MKQLQSPNFFQCGTKNTHVGFNSNLLPLEGGKHASETGGISWQQGQDM